MTRYKTAVTKEVAAEAHRRFLRPSKSLRPWTKKQKSASPRAPLKAVARLAQHLGYLAFIFTGTRGPKTARMGAVVIKAAARVANHYGLHLGVIAAASDAKEKAGCEDALAAVGVLGEFAAKAMDPKSRFIRNYVAVQLDRILAFVRTTAGPAAAEDFLKSELP